MSGPPPSVREKVRGVILGTAVGDSLGLPAEGISRRRAARLFRGGWRHRFILNRGMVSDDTDHTFLVGQCLALHPDDPVLFQKCLASRLRWWLMSLPAGTGLATLRSIARLWAGVDPSRSGVFSAGNGPAMRAAPIGAFFCDDPSLMGQYVEASTRLTHTDPRALTGAGAVAALAAWAVAEGRTERPDAGSFLDILRRCGGDDPEWAALVTSISDGLEENLPVGKFAERLGLERGVTGYIYHTVPVAVYSWYRHFGDFEKSLASVLTCGGDTDTVGAVAGALAGAVTGEAGIPAAWVEGIMEWPRGRKVLAAVADHMTDCREGRADCAPVCYFWPGLLLRNLFFLVIVLLHALRRLLPPY